ncbi:hypothetical protein IEO21_06130 [Rhodonia placenta]|uniref:Uncharacterized protein n=1 Tax=Rhodonia placenta TaxID=104341 RepID=A0A8H7P0M7_9APHY|nr:hypothetical protein IEO21_06130 [Postia placenta]
MVLEHQLRPGGDGLMRVYCGHLSELIERPRDSGGVWRPIIPHQYSTCKLHPSNNSILRLHSWGVIIVDRSESLNSVGSIHLRLLQIPVHVCMEDNVGHWISSRPRAMEADAIVVRNLACAIKRSEGVWPITFAKASFDALRMPHQ